MQIPRVILRIFSSLSLSAFALDTWPPAALTATDYSHVIPNLLRYALDGTAASPASDFRLVPTSDSTGITLTIPRIDDPALAYELWTTENRLNGWESPPFWSSTGASNTSGSITLEVPISTETQLFIHLKVSIP
jgi:hypothetical protein